MESMFKHVKITWMLSILLLALVLFLTLMQGTAPGQVPASWFKTKGYDEERFEAFMQHVNVFYRNLHGCPPTGFPPNIICTRGEGMYNAKEWKIMTEQAQSLFSIEDNPQERSHAR